MKLGGSADPCTMQTTQCPLTPKGRTPSLARTFMRAGASTPTVTTAQPLVCAPRGLHRPAPKGKLFTSWNLDPPL